MENPYWYDTLVVTDAASELWAERMSMHFQKNVDVALAKKRSIATRQAVSSFRVAEPAQLITICCTWTKWQSEMLAAGAPQVHIDVMTERFYTGLIDNHIMEMAVLAKPDQTWRHLSYIDGFLREHGLQKYSAMPGSRHATTSDDNVAESRALEKELLSRFDTMVVRWKHDTREFTQHAGIITSPLLLASKYLCPSNKLCFGIRAFLFTEFVQEPGHTCLLFTEFVQKPGHTCLGFVLSSVLIVVTSLC